MSPSADDIIQEIRALTKDNSYILHHDPLDGTVIFQRVQGNTWKAVSPRLHIDAMHAWLAAYAVGLMDGYLVAKRGK